MYFDLEPKSRREDLYDFDEQLGRLLHLFRERRARAPLIIVTGLRRMGKSSLIQTALEESGLPYLTFNGMVFAGASMITKRELLRMLEKQLKEVLEKKRKWRDKLLSTLEGIRWLRVDSKPPWIHLEWERSLKDFDLLDLVFSFRRMARENRTKFELVFDEAQEFRKLAGYRLQALMAYIYDEVKEIQMVVTGSQFGFLHDFLGSDNPDSPLYGRGVVEIEVPRFSDEQAMDFLLRGFGQASVKPETHMLKLAIEKLDGIAGWLTLFGSEAVERGRTSEKILAEVVEKGCALTAKELKNFLQIRKEAGKRYLRILRSASHLGRAKWSELKGGLDRQEGKNVANKVFGDLLHNLVKSSLLKKNEDGSYSVADPLLNHAIRSGLVRGCLEVFGPSLPSF